MNRRKTERIGADEEGVYSRLRRKGSVMTDHSLRPAGILAGLWLLLALYVVATGGVVIADSANGNITQSTDTVVQTGDTGGQATVVGAGEQLSGLIAVQNASIRGIVQEGSLQAALDAADSPGERADVVDRRLTSIDQQVTDLEQRLSTLESGSDQQVVTARRAEIGANAQALEQLLAEIDGAVASLPADVRDERNLATRIDTLGNRVETLRQQTRDATRTISGVDQTTRVDPVSPSDVEAALNNAVETDGLPGPISGSEELDIRIRTANGSTLRVGVVLDGGSVESVEPGGSDSADVRVYTDYEVVRRIQRSDEPFSEIGDAVDNGRIIYDGVGILNSLRYGVLSFFD